VGGSIIGHGVPVFHHFSAHIAEVMRKLPAVGNILAVISPIVIDAFIGILVGAVCVAVYELAKKLIPKKT
jgi:uncharacterized protein